MKQSPITVEIIVNASLEKVWSYWNEPEHIVGWAFASDDWHAPQAENDLKVGGKFKTVMAAKDGSFQFDFAGTYTVVKEHSLLEYDLGERHVKVQFERVDGGVKVTEIFDPENENPAEMQRQGWQAILENFKKYVEKN